MYVRIRSAPKSSSPQFSESAQCETTQTPPLRRLMDLQRLEKNFLRLQIPKKVDVCSVY